MAKAKKARKKSRVAKKRTRPVSTAYPVVKASGTTDRRIERVAERFAVELAKESGVSAADVRKVLSTLELGRTLVSIGEVVGPEGVEAAVDGGRLQLALLSDRHIIAA